MPYQKRPPEIGDIAIFIQKKNKLFIHRIIKKQRNRFLFKGDNRFSSDGFVEYSNILGMVGNVKRKNKDITLGIIDGKHIVSLFSRLNLIKIYFSLTKKFFGTEVAIKIISIINEFEKRTYTIWRKQ